MAIAAPLASPQLAYDDLRGFIARSQDVDEWRQIDGADWNEEIAALTEAAVELIPEPPMLIFDNIKGYPAGHRVLTLTTGSTRRSAVAYGLSPDLSKLEMVRASARRIGSVRPIEPVEVTTGPVMQNRLTGDDIDLFALPAPRWHRGDGGRYIGTGDAVINRDPTSGYVNAGTYRVQVHDRDLLGLWMSPGQQGREICSRYWARGESCPVVMTFGGDPAVFMGSTSKLPWGQSELAWAGGLRGKPLEVIRGPLTGLPIPASEEIAIEGEVPPPGAEWRDEGPFGEWPGYYSGGSLGTGEPQPVVRVKAMYHRDQPIIRGDPPMWSRLLNQKIPAWAGVLWDQIERAGVPDVVGVYTFNFYFVVIAIKQRYAGHAKQAGMAALACSAAARNGRYVVIVDDDIDVTNMQEVLWAMETRVDPVNDIDVIDGAWSTPLDPMMPPSKRVSGDHTNSRAVFYAVRPFHWLDKFPQVSRAERSKRLEVIEKYRSVMPFPRGY